jgi:CHAT domain-containing protein
MTRAFVCTTCLLLFAAVSVSRATPADDELAEGQRLAARGAFEDSVKHWKQADTLFEQEKNSSGQSEAEIQLAAAYTALGRVNLAIETLGKIQDRAARQNDLKHLAAAKAALGAIYTLSSPPMGGTADHQHMDGDQDLAESNLKESVKLARSAKDSHVEAVALNNLGNLHSYQKKFDTAEEEYRSAKSLAAASGDRELVSQVCANAAHSALKAENYDNAEEWADEASATASKLKNSHNQVNNLIGTGRTFKQLFDTAPDHDDSLRLRALQTFQKAAASAEAIGDNRGLSYALGFEGELYEEEKKYDEAMALTRKAILVAGPLNSPDLLYRWEWQIGRLLRAKKDRDGAIMAYHRAVQMVQAIRHDMALRYGNPNAHSSFREVAGPIYTQLADLILQRAASDADQVSLREARDTIESLRSAELEDYFQDQCVNLLKSKITSVEAISPTSAVIYVIPLPDRTELLVSLRSGIKRVKSSVTDVELTDVAHLFRTNIEKRTTYEYLDQARQLYDWLIKPLTPILSGNKIDTLVFIPDGALRNIPMAALNDGEEYLIQKYAVAVTPGLTLMESKPLKTQSLAIAANGLSKGVQGFAPLPYVPEELSMIKKTFGSTGLLDGQFVKANVEQEFAQENYRIVHIASHGHFDSDAKKTFVLTFDSKLTLDDLERVIRPSQLRDRPVELLVLSACQTAAGDDRAALGLAGVAIKAGARSAFATLWFINDESSAMLVSDFYAQLHDHPEISKAKALQAAQRKLLADQRYAHPCYWAPFLIIGNWL